MVICQTLNCENDNLSFEVLFLAFANFHRFTAVKICTNLVSLNFSASLSLLFHVTYSAIPKLCCCLFVCVCTLFYSQINLLCDKQGEFKKFAAIKDHEDFIQQMQRLQLIDLSCFLLPSRFTVVSLQSRFAASRFATLKVGSLHI